jgi:hypothetical protein
MDLGHHKTPAESNQYLDQVRMLQCYIPRIVLAKECRNQSQSLGEIMSATVCNVLEVVLRTPGESINATMKISAIVLTLSGDLNVNLLVAIQTNLRREHNQLYRHRQVLQIR